MAVQRGIVTPQQIPFHGRRFLVADADGPPCFRDRWGMWHCDHGHDAETPLMGLEDAYQYAEGWTAQTDLWGGPETV